jgi:hypothetical protein
MQKIAIRLEYKCKTYISVYDVFSEEEEAQLIELIKTASKGELDYLQFKCENIKQFFPKHILSESIFGLVYSNE